MLDGQAKEVRRLLSAGDFILAFDTANRALESGNGSLQMKHLAVLSLARSGATDLAIEKYTKLDLHRQAKSARPATLKTDIRALWARLQKDKALSSATTQRSALLVQAADAYEDVYKTGGGSYPAVNAATLRLLAGDADGAQRLATSALRSLARERIKNTYWGAATAAEAQLVLHDEEKALEALARAAKYAGRDFSSIAVTRRQLALICDAAKVDCAVLNALALPAVVHYVGCAALSHFEADGAKTLRAAVRMELDRLNAGFGFGTLAAGADILFAEELLHRKAELHVVLPFDANEFRRVAVESAGGDWPARFDQCLKKAASVTLATGDAFLGDRSLYDYGAKLAIGFAQLRARFLGAEAHQCVLWDEAAGEHAPGAATAVAIARQLKLPTSTIDAKWGTRGTQMQTPGGDISAPQGGRRALKALIFGDFKGFSKLQEHQIEPFTKGVLGELANVIARHGGAVDFRNTWGDGIFLVVKSSSAAARLALDLQRAMKSLPLAELGLPETLGLRLGAHYGPVFSLVEPITGTQNFAGIHVSRTARIEPITPEGQVYVTDAFAADIAADEAAQQFALSYVGNVSAAKGYGNLRMYSLGERTIGA